MVAEPGTAIGKLDRVLRHYLPATTNDQGWILWIEAWSAGLRSATLRQILSELEATWIQTLERVITEGVANGELRCADPAGAAERLDALLDGLLLRATVHPDAIPRDRLLEHARVAAAHEVGVDWSAFPQD
jgi:hypothetical protein